MASVLLSGCLRDATEACDQLCGMPDECFDALGVPDPGGKGCVAQCLVGAKSVGVGCINAIADTISCLPSCDLDSLSDEDKLACQDEAQRIDVECD